MSKTRRGLGRGLGALLGEEPVSDPTGLAQIPVGAIRPNPQQPRKTSPAPDVSAARRNPRAQLAHDPEGARELSA